MKGLALAIVLSGVLAAGCFGPEDTNEASGLPVPAPFVLRAQGCQEAGAYVTWNVIPDDPDIPPGFDTRHVASDLGDPPITTLGGGPTVQHTPLDMMPGSNVTGAYHPILHCATWQLDGVDRTDLWLAWVAVLVHAPPYDPEPLGREYAVGAIGVNDADLARALSAAGIAAETLSVTDFALDSTNMRHVFRFDHHGDIYADVPMRALAAKASEGMRLWIVAGEGGQEVRPVALDFTDEGGTHLVASAPGVFEHTVAGPAPAPIVPIHTFTSWALAYMGFSRTITLGPVVDASAPGHEH
jgi:hypothetical protein